MVALSPNEAWKVGFGRKWLENELREKDNEWHLIDRWYVDEGDEMTGYNIFCWGTETSLFFGCGILFLKALVIMKVYVLVILEILLLEREIRQ